MQKAKRDGRLAVARLTARGEFAHKGRMKRKLPTRIVNRCGISIISS
jgi:hypothetical protein